MVEENAFTPLVRRWDKSKKARMNMWLQVWHAALALFKKPYKAMLGALFLSATALFLPASVADQMQIGGLDSHRG